MEGTGEEGSPREIDLYLSRLNTGTGPGASNDNSRTEVKLLEGVFENLNFLPWPKEELREIFSDASEELMHLESATKTKVEGRLREAHDVINRNLVNNVKENEVRAQRNKAYFQRKRVREARKEAARNAGSGAEGALASSSSRSSQPSVSTVPSKTASQVEASLSIQTNATTVNKQKRSVRFERTMKGNEPNRGSQDDNRPIFETSTSVDPIHEMVIASLVDICGDVLPTYEEDERFFVVTKEQRIVNEKKKDTKENRTLSGGRKHTADKALVRFVGKSIVGRPIIAYEFKGPRMDIGYHARVLDVYEKVKESKRTGKAVEGNVVSRFVFPNGCTHPDPDSPILVSAEVMCMYLTRMFETLKNFRADTRGEAITQDRLEPIAQTILQGLCTQSGDCILYTHQQLLAFEIRGKGENGLVDIYVSPLYRCDHKRGTLFTMVSMSHRAWERAMEERVEGKVREAAKLIKRSSDERKAAREKGEEGKQGSSEESEAEEGSKEGEEPASKRYKTSERGDVNRFAVEENMSFVSSDVDSSTLTVRDVLRDVVKSLWEPHWEGESTTLWKGSFQGNPVIVKVWSEQDSRSLDELRNEVHMYQHIANKFSHLLGSSLPRFYVGHNERIEGLRYGGDVYLITEFVGHTIRRDVDGCLYVGEGQGSKVSLRDERCIREIAISKLRSLHSCDILHGDVAFRNMRVERNPDNTWGLRWIDLGRSWIDDSKDDFEKWLELNDCQNLFVQ